MSFLLQHVSSIEAFPESSSLILSICCCDNITYRSRKITVHIDETAATLFFVCVFSSMWSWFFKRSTCLLVRVSSFLYDSLMDMKQESLIKHPRLSFHITWHHFKQNTFWTFYISNCVLSLQVISHGVNLSWKTCWTACSKVLSLNQLKPGDIFILLQITNTLIVILLWEDGLNGARH